MDYPSVVRSYDLPQSRPVVDIEAWALDLRKAAARAVAIMMLREEIPEGPLYMAESSSDHRVWHRGLPPFPGWWNCSTMRHPDCWRWFDGRYLYTAVHSAVNFVTAGALHKWHSTDASLGSISARIWPELSRIEWNDYWPTGHGTYRTWPNGEIQS